MKLTPEMLAQLPKALRIEITENIMRKDFTQSELAEIQKELIGEFAKPEMKRQGERRDLKTATSTENSVEVIRPKRFENTTEKVARLFGESERTVRERLAVVAAAEAAPEKHGKLVEIMNRTGRVNGAHRFLKVAQQAEAIRREPPPLPGRGPYRVIVADPPWPQDWQAVSSRGPLPYPTMTIPDICGVPAASIAHEDCILWLWTTNAFMRQAFVVLDAWGFQEKAILTWVKHRFGLGVWLRGQTEHSILATRGKPTVQLVNQTTMLQAPVRGHSEKPEEFYDLVERLCPAPRYASLFHRGPTRPNWDGHGDEALTAQHG